jgi:UDP-glucose:(heptosyl)LPS alpha-1,3-glucosyltransferase
MRIALAFPNCHKRGGVERVVLECANFLASRGHETHLLTCQCDEALLDAQVRCHPVSVNNIAWWRMMRFARKAKLVCDEMQSAPDVLASFGVQSPFNSVTWVQSVHRSWIEISRRHRGLAGRWKQRANPFHAAGLAMESAYYGGRRYRKLIALTEAVKADLMRCYDVPERDIEIIPNGFSPAEFNVSRIASRDSVRNRLGFNDDDRVIVFVANELDRKGFGPLLEAIGQLADNRLKLLVVGRVGPEGYQGQIDRLGAGCVRFIGSTPDIAEFYAATDLFALPTIYEAWGLVIVEALACGLRVLTSRLAGASVAVQEGRTGFLLDDPRDPREIAVKLSRLLNSDPLPRSEISDSVASYSWDCILPRYERLLYECAGANKTSFAEAAHARSASNRR